MLHTMLNSYSERFSTRTRLPYLLRRVLLITLAVAIPSTLIGQESGDLAGDDGTAQEIPIPVRIISPGGNAVVVAVGRITMSMELLLLEAAPIEEAFTQPLATDIRGEIESAAEDGWFTEEEFARLGFTLVFDAADLAAEIRIPVSALGTQDLAVYRQRTLPSFPDAENADLAIGFPLYTGFEQTIPRVGDPTSTISITGAPGIHYREWVLESEPSLEIVDGDPDNEIENTRLLRHWLDQGYRLQGGQILQFSRGLQVSERLLGVSFDNLQADNNRTLIPAILDRPLEVTTPGTIDVFVNGRRSRSFQVQPGRYGVTDIPIVSGINSVWVEYTDETGETERYELIIPHTGGLLDHQAWQYAASAGVEEETPSRVSGAGFLRYGALPSLTVGTLLDTSTRGTQVGLDLDTALPFGELSAGGYVSIDQQITPGWAAQSGIRFRRLGNPLLPALSAEVDYRNIDFIRPTPEIGDSRQQWQVTSGVSQALPGEVGLILSHVYRSYHGNTAASSFLYGTLVRSIGSRFSLKVSGFTDFENPEERWGVTITLTARSTRQKLSGAIAYDVRDATADLSGSAGYNGAVTVSGNAGVKDVGLDNGTFGGASGSARVAHPRVDVSGTAGITMEDRDTFGDQEYRSLRYSATAGVGMYFADRAFAVARPLRSAFALVRGSDELPTDQIFVEQGIRGAGNVRSGFLGAAVVGPLQANQTESISVRVPGVPADYSLTPTDYLISPSYRSGTAITIGTIRQLYIRGTLVDETAEPISYVGLTVEPQFELPPETAIGTTAFTDDAGVFDLYSLVPGRYQITLEDGSGRAFLVDVPDVPGPLVEIGEVTTDTPEEENDDEES